MAYSATTIATTMGKQLHDTAGDIWTTAIISEHVDEAQKLIASLRPDASATTATTALTTTSMQTLPDDGVRFLDIPMNTDGLSVLKITREKLTEMVSTWTTETGTAIEFFMFDEENPTVFWVYPKPSEAFNVELVYSAEPTTFTSSSTDIDISAIYITAIYEWTLYRCFSMECKGTDMTLAAVHLQNFFNVLGIKKNNEILLKQVQESK